MISATVRQGCDQGGISKGRTLVLNYWSRCLDCLEQEMERISPNGHPLIDTSQPLYSSVFSIAWCIHR